MLSRAADAAPRKASVFLALGIALQLGDRWQEARVALARAIEIDADYALAYNSLALTQKLDGELEKAAHNYDAGCKALACGIVKSFRNERQSPIRKYSETRGELWTDNAMYAALHLVANDEGLEGVAWLTGEQAENEERTETRGGLYWEDVVEKKDAKVRRFLLNYFNTFRERLKEDAVYSNLLGNRATVLDLLGREEEARQHRNEAVEFLPVTDS